MTPQTPQTQVIRSNETMYKAGQMEKVILRKLAEADPAGKRHCVRLLGSFDYRSHLCLVFESLVSGYACICCFGLQGGCCLTSCLESDGVGGMRGFSWMCATHPPSPRTQSPRRHCLIPSFLTISHSFRT